MFKTLAFKPENGFFVGDLPDSCGSPLSATSPQLGRGELLAIVIIPNLDGMFNTFLTFFEKISPRRARRNI